MAWVEVFAVLVVSHLVGDYLVQTDWQALHKHRGLGRDPVRRRALASHIATYTISFVPAFVWLGGELGAGVALVVATVAIPHWIQDDGRLIVAYMRRIKGPGTVDVPFLLPAVDQSFHILTLFAIALAAAA